MLKGALTRSELFNFLFWVHTDLALCRDMELAGHLDLWDVTRDAERHLVGEWVLQRDGVRYALSHRRAQLDRVDDAGTDRP